MIKSRFAACGASAATAIPLDERLELESAPVALGKNLFPTTPQAATMKKLNTGGELAAQAERSGNPSRNGSPMATVPAPRRNARRLNVLRGASAAGRKPYSFPVSRLMIAATESFVPSGLRFTGSLRRGCGMRRS